MPVRVVERLEERGRAVDAARANHRDLAGEVDERLEHALGATELLPRRHRVGVGAERYLALAVVAQRRRLQHGRTSNARHPLEQVGFAVHLEVRRDWHAVAREEPLFADAVLRHFECGAVGAHQRFLGGRGHRRSRHILELERHHVHGPREGTHLIEVVVRRDDLDVGNLPGRRVVLGRQRVHAVAETARRHGEHASELAAAEDADGGTGSDAGAAHDSWLFFAASAISTR